jgi:iron(III) transport system substrate-binding protein
VTHKILPALLCLLLACAAAGTAMAQTLTTAEVGRFTGPDRMQRLIAGAKKEGVLNLYSSIPLATQTEVTGGFERKYGIKVNLWRAESTTILQRAVTEARGGRNMVDAVETASAEVEALERERLLQEVNLPVFADLIPGSTKAGRAWVASRLVIFVGAYNKNLIKAADAPKTYEDLLNPKWKGKLGIEAENGNWLMALSGLQGEQKTTSLFRSIVAKNGMSFRRGHTLMVNLIASGEVPLGLNVYQEHVDQAITRGAPIQILYLKPLIAQPIGAAVFRRAPHPHAAVLFLDYLLTDAQKTIVSQQMIGTNKNVPRPVPAGLELNMLDVPKYVTESPRWIRLYREIFSGRPG